MDLKLYLVSPLSPLPQYIFCDIHCQWHKTHIPLCNPTYYYFSPTIKFFTFSHAFPFLCLLTSLPRIHLPLLSIIQFQLPLPYIPPDFRNVIILKNVKNNDKNNSILIILNNVSSPCGPAAPIGQAISIILAYLA